MMAAQITANGGVVDIIGDDAADMVTVRTENGQVIVTSFDGQTNRTESFPRSAVSLIRFQGRGGDDSFTNQTDIPLHAWGQAGNDQLIGGSADDVLVGGDGDDVLMGRDGNDQIWGKAGADFLLGGRGEDMLSGGAGDDQLFGEEGNDALSTDSFELKPEFDWQNPRNRFDVNDDTLVNMADLLAIMHYLRTDGPGQLPIADPPFSPLYVDVNGDDAASVGDVLGLVTQIRDQPSSEVSAANGLGESQLRSIVDAALARWEAAGLDTAELRNTRFRIADLPGDALSWTLGGSDGSAVIWIDANAAGQGWFVDRTPLSDSEFPLGNDFLAIADSATALADRTDLLTAISQSIGLSASSGNLEAIEVVSNVGPGVRMAPSRNAANAPTDVSPMAGANGFDLFAGVKQDLWKLPAWREMNYTIYYPNIYWYVRLQRLLIFGW